LKTETYKHQNDIGIETAMKMAELDEENISPSKSELPKEELMALKAEKVASL
jgi:hypothetical protein